MTTKRPVTLSGKTTKIRTECGALYLTLNNDEVGKLYEVRFSIGKTGTCQNAMFHLQGVTWSTLIQCGVPQDKLIRTLKKHCQGVNCGTPFAVEGEKYTSCLDYVAKAIIKELEVKA